MSISIAQIRRALGDAVASVMEARYVRGRLGRKNADGSYSMVVPDRRGYIYVTLTADGGQTVDIAFNKGVPRLRKLPVKMVREGNRLVIVDVDTSGGQLDSFLDGSPSGAVPPHIHYTNSGLEQEFEAFWLEPGRVLWSGTGVTVRLRPLHYSYNGQAKYWPGGTLSLSGNLPATPSKWAWVIPCIDPATNTPVAVTGDEYDAQADLTLDLIADVDVLGYIPCGAVQCQAEDTSLSSSKRYADARHWLGDHGGYYHDGRAGWWRYSTEIDEDSLIVLIPDGPRDAAHGLSVTWDIVEDVGGSPTFQAGSDHLTTPDSVNMFTGGGISVDLVIDADGEVTLSITGGLTNTMIIGLTLSWV